MSLTRTLTTALAVLALGVTLTLGTMTLPSYAQTPKEELAPGDYAGQSTRFSAAIKYCKGLSTMTPAGRDSAAKKLEALKEKEFREQVWDCYDPNWRANRVHGDKDESAKPANYRQRGGYDSFDNVAKGALHVRTRDGKNYNLGNLRGSPDSCNPPRTWHRSEICKPIARGGITCKMLCR